MKSLQKGVWTGIALAVAVVLGFAFLADIRSLGHNLVAFDWSVLWPALALALGNYGVRWIRWEIFLAKTVGAQKPGALESGAIFCAGFVMSITPGKVGELLKSVYLRERRGIPILQTAPVVLMERITDFVSVLLLCLWGVYHSGHGREVVWVGGTLCGLGILVLAWRPLAEYVLRWVDVLPWVGKWGDDIRSSYQRLRGLLSPTLFLGGIGLGIFAWWLECVALYVILMGFESLIPTMESCVFTYAFSTLAGAVTMLPGGLVFTEGSMIALLTQVAPFAVTDDLATGTAVTILVRVCTLWFAVGLGLGAMAWLHRQRPSNGKNVAVRMPDGSTSVSSDTP